MLYKSVAHPGYGCWKGKDAVRKSYVSSPRSLSVVRTACDRAVLAAQATWFGWIVQILGCLRHDLDLWQYVAPRRQHAVTVVVLDRLGIVGQPDIDGTDPLDLRVVGEHQRALTAPAARCRASTAPVFQSKVTAWPVGLFSASTSTTPRNHVLLSKKLVGLKSSVHRQLLLGPDLDTCASRAACRCDRPTPGIPSLFLEGGCPCRLRWQGLREPRAPKLGVHFLLPQNP